MYFRRFLDVMGVVRFRVFGPFRVLRHGLGVVE